MLTQLSPSEADVKTQKEVPFKIFCHRSIFWCILKFVYNKRDIIIVKIANPKIY